MTRVHYKSGEQIIQKNEVGAEFFIVIKGQAKPLMLVTMMARSYISLGIALGSKPLSMIRGAGGKRKGCR